MRVDDCEVGSLVWFNTDYEYAVKKQLAKVLRVVRGHGARVQIIGKTKYPYGAWNGVTWVPCKVISKSNGKEELE